MSGAQLTIISSQRVFRVKTLSHEWCPVCKQTDSHAQPSEEGHLHVDKQNFFFYQCLNQPATPALIGKLQSAPLDTIGAWLDLHYVLPGRERVIGFYIALMQDIQRQSDGFWKLKLGQKALASLYSPELNRTVRLVADSARKCLRTTYSKTISTLHAEYVQECRLKSNMETDVKSLKEFQHYLETDTAVFGKPVCQTTKFPSHAIAAGAPLEEKLCWLFAFDNFSQLRPVISRPDGSQPWPEASEQLEECEGSTSYSIEDRATYLGMDKGGFDVDAVGDRFDFEAEMRHRGL